MILILNFIILVLFSYILYDFPIGLVVFLIAKIAIPDTARLVLGPFNLSIVDVLTLSLLLSYIIHRSAKWKMPKEFRLYLLLEVVPVFFLIFISSQVVPLDYQLASFFKEKLYHEILFIFIGFYAIYLLKERLYKSINLILIASVVCGIYGIISYYLGMNLYISALSIIFNGNEGFVVDFLTEERGGLRGRCYGTMLHPLAWGQFWTILLSFCFLIKDKINNILLYGVLCIGFINIILSGSRTALFSILIFISFYFITLNGKKKITYLFSGCLLTIFICIVMIGANPSNLDYMKSAVFIWDNSYSEKAGVGGSNVDSRQKQFELSLDIAMENPGGYGYNYQYYVLENPLAEEKDLLGLESIIFKKLVEEGFWGLFFFSVAFYYLYRLFCRIKRKIPSFRLLQGYFASFFISIILTGIQGYSLIYFIIFLFLYYASIINIKCSANHS